jgi:DeoR family transcriptional regulator of aga operon
MSAEVGATTFDKAELRTSMAMAANAQRVIVPVGGSKFEKVNLAKMVPLSQIDHLVTDSTADSGPLELIAAAGVQAHVVEVGED